MCNELFTSTGLSSHLITLTSSVMEKIYNQLVAKELKDAVQLMLVAKEALPEVAMEKTGSQDEEEEEPVVMDTMSCLKHVFMGKGHCLRKFSIKLGR